MAKWSAMRGMTGSTARTNSVVANTASIERPSTRETDGGRTAAAELDRGVRASMPRRFYRSRLGAPSGTTRGTGMANCMHACVRAAGTTGATCYHRENVFATQRGNAAYCKATRDHLLAEFGGDTPEQRRRPC